MPSNCPRASRPLNRQAVATADKALYAAHEKAPRPNALFDAAGNKKPLSATDPAQECLRDEWIKNYGNAGGKLEQPKPDSSNRPGQAKQECPCSKANLTVIVRYDPVDAPVKDASVTIKGPLTKTLKTDATGIAKFTDLPPGQYQITSKYDGKNKLVDFARSKIGSTDWAYANAHSGFPKKTNKCNLFVYEMAIGAGFSVPQKSHDRKVLGITLQTVMIPPNAGDWADSSSSLVSFPAVSPPEPGDVIAWSHPGWIDATGHVGIVSYPKDSTPESMSLTPGNDKTAEVMMRRQSVSAGHNKVEENDKYFWHYYDEKNADETARIIFRRM